MTRAEIRSLAQGHLPVHRPHRQRRLLRRRRSPSRSRSRCARTARCWSTTRAPLRRCKAALNSTLSFTHSLTYLSVRCVLRGDIPNNVGVFRCIEVKAPEASRAQSGPAGRLRGARADRLSRDGHHARARSRRSCPTACRRPARAATASSASAGYRDNRKPFIIVDMICGAWGGRPDKDGIEAITNPSQNLSNMPVEVMEAQHPVRVEEYALRARHRRRRHAGAAGSGSAAPIACWRTRRCCSCAPTAWRSRPTDSTVARPAAARAT